MHAPNEPALCEQLSNHRVVRSQFASLLGDGLRLREPLLVDQRVVLLDEDGDALVHLDATTAVPVDACLDLGVAGFEGEFGASLPRGLLDVAPRALDAADELLPARRRDRLAVEAGGGRVEEREGARRIALAHPLRLELFGGDLGGESCEQKALRFRPRHLDRFGRRGCGGGGPGGRSSPCRLRVEGLLDELPGSRGVTFLGRRWWCRKILAEHGQRAEQDEPAHPPQDGLRQPAA